ncbi:MAG: ABC transporter substrate-binding protein [Lachnospiraceae bacterium]|nr:ABC transporter substrate-binding protein [Lachnospiraceae bacterium]
MKKRNRFIASLLAVAMTASLLASCGGSSSGKKEDQSGKQSADASKDSGAMVFASDEFNAKFSPFFSETAPDTMVSDLVNVQLLQLDRTGSIITKGIEGEKKEYNGKEYTYHGISDLDIKENSDGTVFYDFKLKDGLKFSDGEPFTIDDVIFTMYVLADPTYDGNATFFTLPIQGMEEYRKGVDTLFNLILKAGEGNTDFSKWTEEQQKTFWTDYKKAVDAFVKEITDLCVKNGLNKEGDSIAACAANYGYEGLKDDATAMDFFNAMLAKYDGSVSKMSASESAGTQFSALMPSYKDYQVGVETGESAPNITGIQKTGEDSLRIVATKVDAQMIYQLAVTVGALHYYGDKAKFDYDKNQFGFPKGDLSSMREKISKPLGAGAYVFDKYENGVVSLKANDSYYDGAPKVKNLNLKYVAENDKLNSILAGTTDISTPSFTTEVADAIKKANSNGELSGDKIYTSAVDALGYGYIGINSHNVCVNKEPGSEQSKDLRRAFATIFSVYRDLAISSYYGDRASVINYPITNTSWAAPQPTDDGYEIAFSKDADGNPIYTSDMKDEDKYAAAKKAALGFLEKAGYTVQNGKVTAAPAGAKMEYEVMIGGGGNGDHPSFMILTEAQKALAEIGMKLDINDMSNSADMWNKLNARQAEMWCAAWQATPDPDMYQVYYSDVANGGKEPGGSNYMYQIEDKDLDDMIMQARESTDQEYRKTIYRAALDKIIDWACEIPVYQRQEVTTFASNRIKVDTITPDMSSYYKWYSEIQNYELTK